MKNTIPAIDLRDPAVHGNNIGALSGLTDLMEEGGNAVVALFLDLVPERGARMYERYRMWQQEHDDHDAPFHEFARKTIAAMGRAMMLPKFCDFRGTDFGNMVIAPFVLVAITKPDAEMTDEIIAGIHFGVQDNPIVAGVIARHACNGCPNTTCVLNPEYKT